MHANRHEVRAGLIAIVAGRRTARRRLLFGWPVTVAALALGMERWYGAFPGSTGRSLHICGNSTHFLHHLGTLELTSFDLGEMVDLARAKAQLPNTYLWRLADWRVIRDGDATEIETSIMKDLAVGAPGGRFGIHVEGWRGVPLWRVRVAKECVERF